MRENSAGRSLLVVDDEPAFCRFVNSAAKFLDYDVQMSSSARDIMATAAPLPWDAIVLDIVMPDVDGIEVIKWLTCQGYDGRLLVVSGYAPNYARMAAELANASGGMQVNYHTKPISIEDIQAVLS
jgi:CheY-like chemotaxis protein